MLEAFIAQVGAATVVVRSLNDYPPTPGATFVALPNLIYGSAPRDLTDARRFVRLLRSARSYSIIGADVMDGAYNWQASTRKALTAKHAARMGVNARVLGFSWNARPDRRALRQLRAAGHAGAVAFARDPLSEDRLLQGGVGNVRTSADIVFTASTVGDAEMREVGRGAVVVNASGLVAKRVDQVPAYVRLLSALAQAGRRVVLLPHVLRATGDEAALDAIIDALPAEHRAVVTRIERELRPDEVRALVSESLFVVTGRMHLAVMALRMGRPAIVISTQGKVEGLMERFGLSAFVVQPERLAAGELLDAADRMQHELVHYETAVAEALPRVIALADQNFVNMSGGNE